MEDLPPDFFMGSTESYGWDPPRKCHSLKRIAAANHNDYLLVRIVPPLDGVNYRRPGTSVDLVLLASHLRGETLFPVSHWPMDVYVLRPLVADCEQRTELSNDEVELIDWAEMYESLASVPPPLKKSDAL